MVSFPVTHYAERINAICRVEARRRLISHEARALLVELSNLDAGSSDAELIANVSTRLKNAIVTERVIKRLTT